MHRDDVESQEDPGRAGPQAVSNVHLQDGPAAPPIRGSGDRLLAWSHMLFVDHGILRLGYLNLHRVTPMFWRSAQPAPHDVARLARSGIRTIVSLRGGRDFGAYRLERAACESNGVSWRNFVVRATEAPRREQMLLAEGFLSSLTYPALFHCKSGADRTGFMSALYLLIQERRPYVEAMSQLHIRFGHMKWSRAGILDAFFEKFQREGIGRDTNFTKWIEQQYDPQELQREFHISRGRS